MEDWKSQVAEKTFIGALVLFGAWAVKKSKPAWKGLIRLSRLTSDVDELKKKYAVLHHTLEAVITVDSECVFLSNEQGFCTFANDRICELLGGDRDEIEGDGWINFIKVNQRSRVRNEYEYAVKNGKHLDSTFTVINKVSNEEFDCDFTVMIRRNLEGEIIVIFAIIKRK